MKNGIIRINEINLKCCKEKIKDNNYVHVILDGCELKTKTEVFESLGKQLGFPAIVNNYDSLVDWMKDLSWFPKEKGICIYIINFDEFLNKEPQARNIILEIISNDVPAFWAEEVKCVVKGGTEREFLVIVE